MEDKIVQSIVADGKQLDFGTLSQMINRKISFSTLYR